MEAEIIVSRQQKYSRTYDYAWNFSLALPPIFIIIMHFVNSMKTKDHDSTKIYFIKLNLVLVHRLRIIASAREIFLPTVLSCEEYQKLLEMDWSLLGSIGI